MEAVVSAAEGHDGVSPIDDQVRLDLRHGPRPGARHLVAQQDDRLVGYAHLDVAGLAPTGHLVVHPRSRRGGVGGALLDALVTAAAPRPLRLWAHGDLEPARGLAARHGLLRVRDLLRLRRPLDVPLPDPAYPPAIEVRTFQPGRDDDAWVTLNAEAFADHPEQGRLTRDDLRRRMEEPWFDPAGFFLAERDGDLLGFHWTKVHPAGEIEDRAVGEVYAIGVSARARGLGLGRALTTTGLRYLRDRGLPAVVLYVDGDNEAAIATYRGLGFAQDAVDVMYQARTGEP